MSGVGPERDGTIAAPGADCIRSVSSAERTGSTSFKERVSMLTKIKHSKGETEIIWKEENGLTGESIEHKLTCSEPPRPELVDALQAFTSYVIELCELPSEYGDTLSVTGVSINENEHMGTGIVVTSLKKVSKANSPVVINTPHLSKDASCDGGPKWPVYVAGMLDALESEATLYRQGRRSQQELPLTAA
jgi:hypothetical protein